MNSVLYKSHLSLPRGPFSLDTSWVSGHVTEADLPVTCLAPEYSWSHSQSCWEG